ncbi:transposase [Streptomyces sp. NPDC005790]|uniref:transposase n=1 Tax=Streptomyces sp. NPDC005790 TaxID=3154777 RepID=UPI0033CED34F
MVRHYLDEIDRWKSVIAAFDARISVLLAERERDLANLATIPGPGCLAAEIVIAETGGDMAQFASAHRLASWIGVCPGQNESAGVNRSGRTRPGNKNLKRLLGIAAMVAIRKKDSYLGVFFRRLAARRGGKRALVAVMHKLAIAIWHVLHDHAPYRELGADHFTRRDPERAMRRMIKEANSLGMTIRFEPITA